MMPLVLWFWRSGRSLHFLLLALDHGPALQLGDRRVLLDPHDVADPVLVGLVVGVILLRPPHGLLHDGMREAALHANHHGLGLLVADDNALQRSLRHRKPLTFPPRASAARWF